MPTSLPPGILEMPSMPPPPGHMSNFSHRESREKSFYLTSGICLFLMLLSVVFRVYARLKILPKAVWDDVTCGLAILAGVGFIGISMATIVGGPYGHHAWDIKIGDFTVDKLVFTLLTQALCGPCFWFIKLALFTFYLQLFKVIWWFRYSVYFGILATGLLYFATMILFPIFCAPTDGRDQAAYLFATAAPKCVKARDMALALGGINIISDVYMLVLPLPPIWALNLPIRKKLGLATMFSTGLIALIASSLAFVYRIQSNQSNDETWATIPVWDSTIVEMTAGIVVCCMPTTAAVLNRLQELLTSHISPCRRAQRFPSDNRALGNCARDIDAAYLSHQRRANFQPAKPMGRRNSLSLDLDCDGGSEHWSAVQESCVSDDATKFCKTTVIETAENTCGRIMIIHRV